jgi:hypothetical protein
MKYVLFIILFLSAITSAQAVPDYVLLKIARSGGWRLIHLDKPQKKLHKWRYDSKTDTYYRMIGSFGIGFPIKVIASDKQTQTVPDYILFKERFLGGFKLIHLEQPPKKLQKWKLDKNDTYYRISVWGINAPLKTPTSVDLSK